MTGVKDARRMNAELTRLIENYPPENFYAMLNLISSHDIERILTVLTRAGARTWRQPKKRDGNA